LRGSAPPVQGTSRNVESVGVGGRPSFGDADRVNGDSQLADDVVTAGRRDHTSTARSESAVVSSLYFASGPRHSSPRKMRLLEVQREAVYTGPVPLVAEAGTSPEGTRRSHP
jgi:hypothetical protein